MASEQKKSPTMDFTERHFIAEDRVIAAIRALAGAVSAKRKMNALCVHAAKNTQAGSEPDQTKWLTAFERLEWEERDACVAEKRARREVLEAIDRYCEAQCGFLNAVVAGVEDTRAPTT